MNQRHFFEEIRRIINVQKESVFKSRIADLLEISESGAYKKINGITQLSVDEADKICKQLNLKFSLLEGQGGGLKHPFLFYCDDLIAPPPTYEQWASNILNHSIQLNKYRSTYKIWSYQSEISYFHMMPFRNLLYFKLYAWNRSSWQIPSDSKFSISEFETNYALNSLIHQIHEHFVSYESKEIWHVDFFNDLLNQIKYYNQLGIFERQNDLKLLFKDLRNLIRHLDKIAQGGFKKALGKKEDFSAVDIYLNYTHTSSSIMFIKAPDFKMIYNLFLHPNYIRTQDKDVCDYTERWINKIISQSELISGTGELARSHFIKGLDDKVNSLENDLLTN